MPATQIAASILSADFAQLGAACDTVLSSGVDRIHFDVMDNHFVPNLTIGAPICRALREYGITVPIDVHLMAQPVDRLIDDFAEAGATSITCHIEAIDAPLDTIARIRNHGLMAGLALNPKTPLDTVLPLIEGLDILLIMSVQAGFGGQTFLPETLPRINMARTYIDQYGLPCECAVDGGVNLQNLDMIASAGATTLIAGSAIFHSNNIPKTLMHMRQILEAAKNGNSSDT